MKLLKSKAGKFSTGTITFAVMAIIIIVVLFSLYAALVPEAQTAGDSLGDAARCADVGCYYNETSINATSGILCETTQASGAACTVGHQSIPLGALFSGTGIVFVIIMAALLILVVRAYLNKGK